MVGLIIYYIGALIALGLLYSLTTDLDNKTDAGMIIVGTILSWITVVFIIYKIYTKEN